MDDREAIAVDRPLRLLRHEVVHHAQEARGQEEADCVVAVPPLGQRILHAGEGRVALGTEEGDRHRQVVHDVQHGDGDDEGEVEPVGDVDVRFLAPEQREQEDQQVSHPDECQPDIDVPLRFRIFLRLGDTHDVTGCGQHDEELIAPEDEPVQPAQRQSGTAGPLHDVETGGDQRIAAEGKDHRRGMQRPQASETAEGISEVQLGERQLQGDDQPDQKAHDPPEHGRDDAEADNAVGIAVLLILLRWPVEPLQQCGDRDQAGRDNDPGMGLEQCVVSPRRTE